MPNFLRPLRPNVFQVIINDHVAAVLAVLATSIAVYIDRQEAALLTTIPGTDINEAAIRIAAGEFDDDFRFDISDEPDEDGNYMLAQIATPSQTEIYRSSMRDPYSFVQAERECQSERCEFPDLEDRFALYAERGW